MGRENSKRTDSAIIKAFFERDAHAISYVSSGYEQYLYKIAHNILAGEEDVKECINDTYLKLWNSIPPNRPENFKAYIAKLIRNIAINRYKEKSRDKRIPSELTCSLDEMAECLPDISDVEKEYDGLRLRQAISGFVGSLPKRQKYIFVCRYYCGDPIDTIAESLNISGSMVFHELSDIRKKLKDKLIKEGLWYEG